MSRSSDLCGVGVCDFVHHNALPGWQLLFCLSECKPFVGWRSWWAPERQRCVDYRATCAMG